MIELLSRQLGVVAVEKKLERDEFDSLVKLSDVKCRVILIEKWARGYYIKIRFDTPRLAYQTGELVTLIGGIDARDDRSNVGAEDIRNDVGGVAETAYNDISATVLFDNSAVAILFSTNHIERVKVGDEFSCFGASKNTYSFDVQIKSVKKVARAMGNNRLITNIIKGKFHKIEKKKFKIQYKSALDAYQKKAVEHSIYSRDFACIFGPPGTGKTTTLAELIYQLVNLGEFVLVACPSNAAVDVLFTRTLSLGVPAVRVGKGATVKELLLHASTSTLFDEGLPVITSESQQGSYSRRMKLMQTARVLFTTCIGTSSRDVEDFSRKNPFDTLIIDEAGNCLESVCYVGFFSGAKRVIFAGDHFQLPPNVKSPLVPESILERLSKCCPYSFSMLKRQYRMNSEIVKWSNFQFYGGELESDERVANSMLNPKLKAYPPIVWFDAEGEEEFDGGSKYNRAEAECLYWYLKFLFSLPGADIKDITIITPYKAQARLLRTMVDSDYGVRILSVDASQGSESDVVILSLVSCNRYGCIGFLEDYRRMNVAVTRAKRHLAIFGSPSTFCHNHITYLKLLNGIEVVTPPWYCTFFDVGYYKEMFILYIIGRFNRILPYNGYFIKYNWLLAQECLRGNVTSALQYITPNPLSNVLFALVLLSDFSEDNFMGLVSIHSLDSAFISQHTRILTQYISRLQLSDLLWILNYNLRVLGDIGVVAVK